jgi:hypothetical protein
MNDVGLEVPYDRERTCVALAVENAPESAYLVNRTASACELRGQGAKRLRANQRLLISAFVQLPSLDQL